MSERPPLLTSSLTADDAETTKGSTCLLLADWVHCRYDAAIDVLRIYRTCAWCSAAGVVSSPSSCSVRQLFKASFRLDRPFSSIPCRYGKSSETFFCLATTTIANAYRLALLKFMNYSTEQL